MSKKSTQFKTGGQFLLESIFDTEMFSREDFSDEHRDIYNMVMDFDRDRVLSQKDEIEKSNQRLGKFSARIGKEFEETISSKILPIIKCTIAGSIIIRIT